MNQLIPTAMFDPKEPMGRFAGTSTGNCGFTIIKRKPYKTIQQIYSRTVLNRWVLIIFNILRNCSYTQKLYAPTLRVFIWVIHMGYTFIIIHLPCNSCCISLEVSFIRSDALLSLLDAWGCSLRQGPQVSQGRDGQGHRPKLKVRLRKSGTSIPSGKHTKSYWKWSWK